MKEVSVTICCSLLSASVLFQLFCVSLEVHEHLIAINLCGCAVVKKCNCGYLCLHWRLAAWALATPFLRLLSGLTQLAFQLPASQPISFSLCLLPKLAFQLPRPQLLSFSLRLLSGLTQLAILYRSGQHYGILLCMPGLHHKSKLWTHVKSVNTRTLQYSNEVHTGHFFLQCQCYCHVWKLFITLSILRFKNFSLD